MNVMVRWPLHSQEKDMHLLPETSSVDVTRQPPSRGILQKATSPAILTKYSAVLDAVSDMFLTNIPTSTISDLVKLQLSDGTAWNIQTYSIEGTTQPPAGQGPAYLEITGLRGASVVYPYADSINTAIQLMSKIQNGDVFDVDEYVDSLNNNSN